MLHGKLNMSQTLTQTTCDRTLFSGDLVNNQNATGGDLTLHQWVSVITFVSFETLKRRGLKRHFVGWARLDSLGKCHILIVFGGCHGSQG